MALSDNDIAYVRDFIGSSEPPDDFTINEIYNRIGTLTGTAYAILNGRLGDYLSTAASYSIVGVYQESTQANIDNLRQLLKDMASQFPEVIDPGAGGGTVKVSHLVRYGRAR